MTDISVGSAIELNKIYTSDSVEYMKRLPDKSINCIVTSPPYFNLRDYGVEGQIGLEETPAEYINRLCAVFDEAKRVLRDDGTIWVNIGDTYSTGGRGESGNPGFFSAKLEAGQASGPTKKTPGFKTNTLLQVPQRFAIEMIDRGWLLRNDIIWSKPNPMPESVENRFTKSHEHVYFMTKRQDYWADMYSARERASYDGRKDTTSKGSAKYASASYLPGNSKPNGFASGEHERWRFDHEGNRIRNPRDVWVIPTESNSIAHFAVMPSRLVERCILVGCPRLVCKTCGKPYSGIEPAPSCDCPSHEAVPGVVFDPFMGSGTVARAATKMRRNFYGCDLNPEYVDLAEQTIVDGVQVELFA